VLLLDFPTPVGSDEPFQAKSEFYCVMMMFLPRCFIDCVYILRRSCRGWWVGSKTLPTTLLGVAELKDWKTSLQIIAIDKGSRHHRRKKRKNNELYNFRVVAPCFVKAQSVTTSR
jgi:hypothetical protein